MHEARTMSKSASEFMCNDWNVYRTRFLVRAKQLTKPLAFTDPLGREHHGRPGDYLVQSGNGLLRIAPREIFEDVYVMMEMGTETETETEKERKEPKSAFRAQPARDFQPAAAAGNMHI
jgi:hypothetical protein